MKESIDYNSLTLPDNYDVMEKFIINNKVKLMEQVISSIYFAIKNDLSNIEVFNFNNSDFIVTLEYQSFKDNIEHIYKFYLDAELYEYCNRVNQLKKLLELHEQKQKQKKGHQSKNSSKRKNKG